MQRDGMRALNDMDLHEFISAAADAAGYLITVDREVDPYLEAAAPGSRGGRPAGPVHAGQGQPYPVVVGRLLRSPLFRPGAGRAGRPGDVPPGRGAGRGPLPPRSQAWDGAGSPIGGAGGAPCQEVVEPDVDLEAIPFLTHYAGDGGAYASAAVAFINDPDTGPNASYHRLLRLDGPRLAARLVERRGTETAWRKAGRTGLPVAICIGLPPHVLLAASMAPPPGVDEMTIAQALAPTPMALCANGIRVPAEAEFVLEGRITQRARRRKGRSSISPARMISCAGSR